MQAILVDLLAFLIYYRMSQLGTNFNMKSVSARSSGMIGGVIFFAVLMIVLYYVYNFLYGSTAMNNQSISVIPSNVLDTTKKGNGVIRCDATIPLKGSSDSAVAQVDATGMTSGGQYAVTMWISVGSTTPQSSGTGPIPLLDITSSAKTLLYIGLTPTNGTLIVHQGTGETADGSVGLYGMNQPTGSSPYSATDRCNIVNGIEYQRWILIAVVGNGRTLDVYIDGKLSRSCVYKGLNDLGVNTGKGTITVGRHNTTTGVINGVFSSVDYFNYSLTPDIIWSIYQSGPATTTSSSLMKRFFSTDIDLSMGLASN
jgi:hypothetical protein